MQLKNLQEHYLIQGASNVNNCFNPWIHPPRVEIILYNKYINYFSPYVNYKIRWSPKYKHQRGGFTSSVCRGNLLRLSEHIWSCTGCMVCSQRKKSFRKWVRTGLKQKSPKGDFFYIFLKKNMLPECRTFASLRRPCLSYTLIIANFKKWQRTYDTITNQICTWILNVIWYYINS